MLLELFPFVTLNNAMAFIYAYFSLSLRFDMSILLLTVPCGGYLISNAYCHFFHSSITFFRNLIFTRGISSSEELVMCPI